ncbi:MAG: type I restriction endonuclease subunit R [Chloroflexi bacterium]|nr:type I restriction endonuclease subunit R [Chloroflexota bacterium]
MKPTYTEDSLVEQPAITLFAELGWDTADCFKETFGAKSMLGRETSSEVVLVSRLRPALERLNPNLPAEAIQLAIDELTRDRSLVSSVQANSEIYQLLKDGVKVLLLDENGDEIFETVRVIDWDVPENNDYFLASQLWVTGELHKRRPDLIGFVNGIPLVFVELKATHIHLENGYKKNLRDYKDTIPHLFWYNAVVIISNGSATRIGSISAPWEHFNEWKKINSEGEEGIVSLETATRGICAKSRLLDITENFSLFAEKQGGLQKLVAKNHQYLGTNNAFDAVKELKENQGKLGVFWHTQGSGKSYSMIFFAQKVLRQLAGSWTFVIITDRLDLDDQIYKNFASVGAVNEPEERVRAQSGAHLKDLLEKEDHRYVFSLIQKFHTEKGETYPVLSERSDIIVITDESHRSQYDVLALNMRNALPKAAFIAFTGTPLIAGEERTKQVFGDYVSVYNFAQSVEDNATVPLYYENRIPELQLTNQNLNEDMERLLEDAELDEAQEIKLEREFSREYHLITRDERLEKVAEDIVLHFMGRGFYGKAMVVSVDKATAIRTYDRVKKYWNIHLLYLEAELEICNELDRPELEAKIKFMRETDMAVVVSQGQNEIAEMKEKGLDIESHRRRMLTEDLDTKFKDPEDPFGIVFVCAMWMTGFDVPSCSTIYLDKPMRNHTLMQTIARANRVWGEKVNGLIVDYIGVFRDLQRALAIYGTASTDETGDLPVQTKKVLVEELKVGIEDTREFLSGLDVDLQKIQHAAKDTHSFTTVALLDDAVDAILVNDDTKREYLTLSGIVDRFFKAILPDAAANQFGVDRKTIVVIAEKIRNLTPPADISDVMGGVETLLNYSIAPKGYVIKEPASGGKYLDLSKINFEALKLQFKKGHKRIEAEKLRGQINNKLSVMIALNKSRMNYYQQFQKLISEYNAGAKNIDAFFAELISLAQDLSQEEQRGIAENLSEEELTLLDLLTRPAPKLSRKERDSVKEVVHELLDTLKAERLILDWRKGQQSRAAVQLEIETFLDKLPEAYNAGIYEEKCELIYQHIYDSYYGDGVSIYSIAI